MAKHAHDLGAPAIATVPPYYERSTDVNALCTFLAQIGAAAPDLPLFYYHIPGMTGADIKMGDLFRAAAAPANRSTNVPRVPTLAGVKFVSSDLADWLDVAQNFNTTRALLFATEPKLASFPLGLGRGTILAEDFFAPTYLRMWRAYLTGDTRTTIKEQQWKLTASAVLSSYGGQVAERALYRAFTRTMGFDFGPPRPPKTPFIESQWPALYNDLEDIGFWGQLVPP